MPEQEPERVPFASNHLLRRAAAGDSAPMLLLHGAATGAWIWEDGFSARLNAGGRETASFTFRRIGRKGGPAGLDDFLAETRAALEVIGRPTLLVAHSLGSLVAQRLLADPAVLGAAMLAPVPPEGLWWSNLRLAFSDPFLWGDVARMSEPAGSRQPARNLKSALFAGLTDADAARHLLHLGGESRAALLEAQSPQPVPPRALHRKPVLILGGEADPLIPADAVKRCAAWHGTSAQFLANTAHLMMLDSTWPQVADEILEWAATIG
ncbi:alpha/beta hydrolase [Humitalea sp. 24SJ18S-53]|uniref:alpha/beta hydrolase n=1 Tax=Humitalea sp. 24SJ18S-53 TaxID=3422307 RepID=UPI003D67CA65